MFPPLPVVTSQPESGKLVRNRKENQMPSEYPVSIKSDPEVKILKAFINDFRIDGRKKLRLPPKAWMKIAKLTETYLASALASELGLAESTLHKKLKMYGNKKSTIPKKTKSISQSNPSKADQDFQPINLIELPLNSPAKVQPLEQKSDPEKLIAEITNRSGMTVRIFSGIDAESLKLLTSMA